MCYHVLLLLPPELLCHLFLPFLSHASCWFRQCCNGCQTGHPWPVSSPIVHGLSSTPQEESSNGLWLLSHHTSAQCLCSSFLYCWLESYSRASPMSWLNIRLAWQYLSRAVEWMNEFIYLLCIHSDKTHHPSFFFTIKWITNNLGLKKKMCFSPPTKHLKRKPELWVNSFASYPKLSSPVGIWDLLVMIWACCFKTNFFAHTVNLLPWLILVLRVEYYLFSLGL